MSVAGSCGIIHEAFVVVMLMSWESRYCLCIESRGEKKEIKKEMNFALQGSSSVNCLNSRRFRIMTSNPIVTITIRANPNQPRTIAEVPTPLLTLPFPRS